MNISATGLHAASKMAQAISQNIANSNTPGYRRVDVVTGEMNFSGPGNVPFAPGGVRSSAITQSQPWLDNRLSLAVNQSTHTHAYQQSINQFASVANTDRLEDSFSQLMAASQDAMANLTGSQAVERFKAISKGMVLDMNQYQEQAQRVIDNLKFQQNVARQELVSINELPGDNLDRKNQLYAEISGIQKALDGVIGESVASAQKIIGTAVKDINDKYGKEILAIDAEGKVISDFKEGGDFAALAEYGNQQFNTDLGAIKSKIGVAQRSANSQVEFAQNELEGASQAWNQVYGVDLTQEAIKLRQTETYQQANALALKTASDMTGTLLNMLA